MQFSKFEGLGNDFVVVACEDPEAIATSDVIALCDRRRGVGADGVLMVLPPRTPDALARMRVVNADGSVPEMCGNGLRCVALALASSGAPNEFVVDTDAGPRTCRVETSDSDTVVSVDMGLVKFLGDVHLDIDGKPHTFHRGDAGNPHAITFATGSRAEMEHIGLALNAHAAFPNGTNVEFATLRERSIDLVVFERGVGFTEACGTGACATVAVACALGKFVYGSPVVVNLPGGPLSVSVATDGRTQMRGPARFVFRGEWPRPCLA